MVVTRSGMPGSGSCSASRSLRAALEALPSLLALTGAPSSRRRRSSVQAAPRPAASWAGSAGARQSRRRRGPPALPRLPAAASWPAQRGGLARLGCRAEAKDPPVRFGDRDVVDAGLAAAHQSVRADPPLLAAQAATPLVDIGVAFGGARHRAGCRGAAWTDER